MLKRGMRVTLDLGPSRPLPGKASLTRHEPEYTLYVQEVDELFVSICRGGRNLKLFTLNETAKQHLRNENLMAAELP